MSENPIQTLRLFADAGGIATAAAILREGGLVAFPTETVYGLGADATNGEAVARIYAAKGRPSFNPLIVHVSDQAMAETFGAFPAAARDLISTVWPGPLTVVVPLRDGAGLSSLVTAGLPSVGLRMPASDTARALIAAVGRPLAAPSANLSGRISPTTAAHVLGGLDGRIDAVIDGGPTPMGVESTIIGFLGDRPRLLREGAYLPDLDTVAVDTAATDRPQAPGQLASHYAPLASVRLNADTAHPGEFLLGFGDVAGDRSLSPAGSLTEAAANLYAMLHEIDALGVMHLAVAPIPNHGLGRAINDRLTRAAAPRD